MVRATIRGCGNCWCWRRGTPQPAIALDSIDVLTHGSEDNAVREVLIEALRYDKNPGVRLKSLDALKGYVRDDIHVRDAVVEALLHDSNAGVRQEAISLLDVVKADTSVRSALTVLRTAIQTSLSVMSRSGIWQACRT